MDGTDDDHSFVLWLLVMFLRKTKHLHFVLTLVLYAHEQHPRPVSLPSHAALPALFSCLYFCSDQDVV